MTNFAGDGRNLVGDLKRDGLHAVTIGVNQITRPYRQATDLDRAAEIKHVGIGMGDRDVAGEHLKLRLMDIGKIANRAVRHDADASYGEENIGVNLSDEGAYTRRVIDVFDHHNARRWNR